MDLTDANKSLRYFKEDEFNKACPPCSLRDMDDWFMLKLDRCRELAKCPFYINSAFRSADWEREHGRNGTSAHVHGLAVDIACTDSRSRFKILSAAFAVGFTRIGVHDNYIHLDDSFLHTDFVVWLYEHK